MGASCQSSMSNCTICAVPPAAAAAAGAYSFLEQDCIAFVTTVVYIAYYCIRVVTDRRRVNPVNPMLACIAAAVQRVYGSAENPYSQTIAFMMLTWSLHKTSMLGRKSWPGSTADSTEGSSWSWLWESVHWWRGIDILADCLLISIMLYAGVMGQASTTQKTKLHC